MKAVLILDEMPENCFNCKLDDVINCRSGRHHYSADPRPNWCPLKPIPEKKNNDTILCDSDYFECVGFNRCIDEILGDGK